MSKESLVTLNNDTLIGFTDKRGEAWHYREELQGDEPNHYPLAIPVEDVKRRLFHWEAVELPLFVKDVNGDFVTVPDRKAIARSDTRNVLGVFKQGYQPHQYDEWLVQNVSNIIDSHLAIASAGLLKGGGQAWVQIEMEETLDVGGFEYRPFLLASTSFDGSLSTSYRTGNQAVVCDNTLAMALGEKDANVFKTRHSKYSNLRIHDAREALGIVYEVGEDFQREVEALLNIEVSDPQFTRILDTLVPVPTDEGRGKTVAENKRQRITSLYTFDERVKPWTGTGFGVVQAFNTWQHHFSTVRKGVSRGTRNMENVLNGKTSNGDDQVVATVLQVVGAGV